MRRIKLVLLIVVLTFMLTGCNGNVTRDIRHAGFTLSTNELICKDLIPEKESGVDYVKKISFMNNDFAITEDGEIYEMSMSQKYSSEENCRRAEFDKNVVAMKDENIIKADDGKFYYTPTNNNATAYTEVSVNDNSYAIYKLLLSDETVKKVITVDQNSGSYYVLLDDGNIYNYIITRTDYNSPYVLQSKEIVYYKADYNDDIIDFSYNTTSKSIVYLKTKSEIYRLQATNQEECSKYVDVECNYELKKDEVLTKYYKDKILYYGPSILITTYGKIFS